MFVHKCDLCKKEIKDTDKMVSAGIGRSVPYLEFCAQCGAPIVEFLKKNNLKIK